MPGGFRFCAQNDRRMDRRRFLFASSALTLAACSLPENRLNAPVGDVPFANQAPITRLEVSEFSRDAALVRAFRDGIAAMRKIANAQNAGAYDYWHNSHWMAHGSPPRNMETVWNQCRHKVSYFFGWHRGFLVFFEHAMRKASGNPRFALPYWDYYSNPKLPSIFTEPALRDGSSNPLYWPNRRGTTVEGLSYAPFASKVTTFPFGPGETYEDLVERNPHGHVHDQVGGSMGRVPTAVADPIFWVHHSNIDRLWTAWVAAGGKRAMPDPEALWWDQTFFYNVNRTWRASMREMNNTKHLGYRYDDVSLPKAPAGAALPVQPAVVATGAARAAGPIALRLEPVTIEIPIDADALRAPSLALTLDGVALTDRGADGGYSFGVYVNLPHARTALSQEAAFSIGEIGPFELSMPGMQGMLRFGLADALRRQTELRYAVTPSSLRISFVPFGKPSGVARNAELIRISRLSVTG